jgi:hypothetical protein
MSVTVTSGANSESLNVAGQSVGAVRARFATALNIGPGTTATVWGDPVSEDYILEDGETLRFAKTTAEKGFVTVATIFVTA